MFAMKLVGDAIDRERCDQVARDLADMFTENVKSYVCDPSIADWDAAFNDLKESFLREYDKRVGAKSSDKDDCQNSIRRRILGRNIDKNRDAFNMRCESQCEAHKLDAILNEQKMKTEAAYREIETTQLPMKKSALRAKVQSMNLFFKNEFLTAAAAVTTSIDTQRLKDFDDFLNCRSRDLHFSNINAIQAIYEYNFVCDFEVNGNNDPDATDSDATDTDTTDTFTTAFASSSSSSSSSSNGKNVLPVATQVVNNSTDDNNHGTPAPIATYIGNCSDDNDDAYTFVPTQAENSDDDDNDDTHTV